MGKIEKSFYWLCFFLAIYITIGFKLIPSVIKDQLVKNLDENLTLKTTIEKVEFNPFTLEAKIHNFALNDDNKQKIITFSQFKLNVELLRSIFETHVSLHEVLLQDTIINITEELDGSINLTKLLKEKEVKKEDSIDENKSDIKFLISKIKLDNLNINYTKITKDEPYKFFIKNATYTLYDVGTYKNRLASNHLELDINEDSKLIVKGAFNVSPFKMYGKIDIINLKLKEILYQQKEILDFDINKEASFDLALDYNINTQKEFDLKLNTRKLELSNINISKNKEDIVKLKKLQISRLDLDLLNQNIKLDDIQIKDLYTNLIIDKNGVNLANLIKTNKEKPKEEDTGLSKPWNILLTNLKQTNSNLIFSDKINNTLVKTQKYNTNISKINVNGSNILLNNFKISNPVIQYINNKDSKKPMNINLNNSVISFDNLSMKNNNIDLSNIIVLQNNINFKDEKASLDIGINKPKTTINSLKIKDSNVYIGTTKFNTPKITFNDSKNKLNIQTNNTSLITNDISIEKSIISINNIKLDTATLNFNDLNSKLKINTNNTNLALDKLNINGSKISMAKISLINPRLNINDKTNDLELDINEINANINSFLLNKNDITFKTAKINQGDLKLNDRKSQLNINSEKMEININNFKQNKQILELSSLSVFNPNIAVINKKDKTNIIAKNIDISITDISNSKEGLKVLKTNITKPDISVVLEKNTTKSTNTKDTKSIENKSETKLDIGPINITNATLSFEDKNLPLPFKTTISKLNGKVSKLNTTQASTSELKVNGIVDKYGTTQITGIVNPKSLKILTDINMIFKNISVQNFTPYSGKFIGKELESGKLSLDLKYNIEKSNLDAKNNIVITKLKLGKKIESKDAVSLPLDLAITLLEDTNGIIDLNIPISGNMDDPQFAVAPIVWKAFVNLITKAITAPFSLLGAIFGFEASEIKSVNFDYGQKDITPIQKETLDKISIILQKRPNLVLEFDPSYDKLKDLQALKTIKFKRFVSNKLPNKQNKNYELNYLELLEDLYEDFDQKIEPLKKKLSNDKKAYKNTLEEYIISKQKIEKSELLELASNRVENIKRYLLEKKKINVKQIKISKKIDIKTQSKKTLNINLKISK